MKEQCESYGEVVQTGYAPFPSLAENDVFIGERLSESVPIAMDTKANVTIVLLDTFRSLLGQTEKELRKASPHPADCAVVGFEIEHIRDARIVLARKRSSQRRLDDEDLENTAEEEVEIQMAIAARLKSAATKGRQGKLTAETAIQTLRKEPDPTRASQLLVQMIRSASPITIDNMDLIPAIGEPAAAVKLEGETYRLKLKVREVDFEKQMAICVLAGGEKLERLFENHDLDHRRIVIEGSLDSDIQLLAQTAAFGIEMEADIALAITLKANGQVFEGRIVKISQLRGLRDMLRDAEEKLFTSLLG